eukprot:scaffold3184_cov254-Pinguiococcus_pyrenoidosus.AAC.4
MCFAKLHLADDLVDERRLARAVLAHHQDDRLGVQLGVGDGVVVELVEAVLLFDLSKIFAIDCLFWVAVSARKHVRQGATLYLEVRDNMRGLLRRRAVLLGTCHGKSASSKRILYRRCADSVICLQIRRYSPSFAAWPHLLLRVSRLSARQILSDTAQRLQVQPLCRTDRFVPCGTARLKQRSESIFESFRY